VFHWLFYTTITIQKPHIGTFFVCKNRFFPFLAHAGFQSADLPFIYPVDPKRVVSLLDATSSSEIIRRLDIEQSGSTEI